MLNAVLLAAGVGNRLQGVTDGRPKCLLPFGGQSLLARHLCLLAQCGVEQLTIVTGHEAIQINQHLDEVAPACAPDMRIETTHNADFRAGSAASVLAAHDVFTGGSGILLMDADVLYDTRLLSPLATHGVDNALTIDRSVDRNDTEAVKVALDDDRIVDFAKTLTTGATAGVVGESAGFFRLTPATAAAFTAECQRAIDADGEAAYETALRELILDPAQRFESLDITGLPWIEIDYPADVERAAEAIEPALQPPELLT